MNDLFWESKGRPVQDLQDDYLGFSGKILRLLPLFPFTKTLSHFPADKEVPPTIMIK